MESRLDHIYRSALLTKFFTRGWGNPSHIEQIIKLRKLLGNRKSSSDILKREVNATGIEIVKEEIQNGMILLTGRFRSPIVNHLEHICPKEIHQAHFQVVLPNSVSNGKSKPLVLQLAGTGDHYFW